MKTVTLVDSDKVDSDIDSDTSGQW